VFSCGFGRLRRSFVFNFSLMAWGERPRSYLPGRHLLLALPALLPLFPLLALSADEHQVPILHDDRPYEQLHQST
jgi:hypothetical protein